MQEISLSVNAHYKNTVVRLFSTERYVIMKSRKKLLWCHLSQAPVVSATVSSNTGSGKVKEEPLDRMLEGWD